MNGDNEKTGHRMASRCYLYVFIRCKNGLSALVDATAATVSAAAIAIAVSAAAVTSATAIPLA